MKKVILATLVLFATVARLDAQTRTADFPRIRTTDATATTFETPGANFVGSARIWGQLFLTAPPVTLDGQVQNPPGLEFRVRFDQVGGGIAEQFEARNIWVTKADPTASTFMHLNAAAFGAQSNVRVVGDQGLEFGNATTLAVSPTGAGRIRYNSTTNEFELSRNGTAWTAVSTAGGSVTSVGLALPASVFTVTGSPVTTTGTLTGSLNTQTANTVFAGPGTGAAAAPSFRGLIAADIPLLDAGKITTGIFDAARLPATTTYLGGSIESTEITDGTIVFADWNSNACVSGNIPKWNGTAWACAGDDTSPGGSSWLTNGNTLGAIGAFIGSTDNFAWDIRSNNLVRGTVQVDGDLDWAGRIDFTNATANYTAIVGGSNIMIQQGVSVYPNRTSTLPTGSASQSFIVMDNGILKVNQAGAGWVPLLDESSWTLTGNALAAQGIFGTTTNFGVDIRTNNIVRGAFSNTGDFDWNDRIDLTNGGSNYVALNGPSNVGTSLGFYGFVNRTSALPTVAASQSIIVMDNGILKVNEAGTGWKNLVYTPPSRRTLSRWTPQQGEQPAANFATFDTRNNHPVLDFDAATDELVYFTDVLPEEYDGGSVEVQIYWAATSAGTDNVVWCAAFELIGSTQDLDVDGWGPEICVTQTTLGTIGAVRAVTIPFSNAQADAITAGNPFRLYVKRDANAAGDTMAGDAEVRAVHVRR